VGLGWNSNWYNGNLSFLDLAGGTAQPDTTNETGQEGSPCHPHGVAPVVDVDQFRTGSTGGTGESIADHCADNADGEVHSAGNQEKESCGDVKTSLCCN